MRYCFAAFVAAFVLIVDFTEESYETVVRSVVALPVSASAEVVERDDRMVEVAQNDDPLPVQAERTFVASDEATGGVSYRAAASPDGVCLAIKAAAEETGIPIAFFARLLWQESRFRAEEISPAGARGIAQFMPQTALEVGLRDPFDPMQAIPASARFLRKLHDQFGNLGLAAAAYNAGGGRIEKWLAGKGPLPSETRAYVQIVTGSRAEDWTLRSKIIPLSINLPRQAPCEGIGGLSKSRLESIEVSVTLTQVAGKLIGQADAQTRASATPFALKRAAVAKIRKQFSVVAANKARLRMARRGPAEPKAKSVKFASASAFSR